MANKKKKRTPGVRKQLPHRCSKKCRHTCGEAGGKTVRRKLCKLVTGKLTLCTLHGGTWAGKSLNAMAGDPVFNGLTMREALFVRAYCGVANCNQSEAARLAGCGGSTRAAQQTAGSKMMQNPKVQKVVRGIFDDLFASPEETKKRITDDARVNIAGLIHFVSDGHGGQVASLNLTPENLEKFGCLIKEIETDPLTGMVRKVKLVDGQAARRDLAKIHRLFSDMTVEVNVNQIKDLSDKELLARLEATRARLVPRHHRGEESGNGA